MDIDARTVIVTGGAGGAGEVIARAVAAAGARVIVADLEAAAADRVAAGLGHGAIGVAADLSRPDGVEAVVAAAGDEVAGLVNCAGGWGGAGRHYPVAAAEQWQAVLQLNLISPMALTQRLLPVMSAAGGGAVVNVSSSAGVETTPYRSPEYAASKAGLVRFTSALGGLRDTIGVRVNCVVPHWIGLPRAEQEKQALDEPDRSATPAFVPPRLVADTVLDLLVDDDLTGQVCVLEGGARPYFLR